jgi:hypothetical protein
VSEHTPVYSVHIIDNGRVTLGVLCDECEGEAQALNWAYYYLGRYHCSAEIARPSYETASGRARRFQRDDPPFDPHQAIGNRSVVAAGKAASDSR